MPKKPIEIASETAQTQVNLACMTAANIILSLRQLYSTISELHRAKPVEIGQHDTQETAPARALTPLDSLQNDQVSCLELGAEINRPTQNHPVVQGMKTKYRKRYSFTMQATPAAKALTKARSAGH